MDDNFIIVAAVDADERNYRERLRLRQLRNASNPFEMSEVKFKKMFRLPKESAQWLCQQINGYDQFNNGCILKHLMILAALHFYTDGSYQTPDGADSIISLSQPSVSRAIEATTNAIVDVLAHQYIRFPLSPEEKQHTIRKFQELYNMPNVLGAVDGTHISIFKPSNYDLVAP